MANIKEIFIKNKGKIIFAFLLLVIGIIILFNSTKHSTFTEYNKILSSIVFDGDKVYFTFTGDPLTYIAYKNNGVDFDLLSALNVGDSLNVLLKDGSGNSTYTIIYILKQGENLLFDVTEFYRNNDLIVSIIFTSIPMLASVILICLSISNAFGTVSKEEFKVYCIAKWTHTFFLIFFLLGFLVMVEILVFYFAKLIPQENLGFVFVPLIFTLIGGFGIIVYRRSFISYKNGTYSFGDLFRTHHINNGEFDKIVCKLYLPQKVYFLNEKSEIVLKLKTEIRYIVKAEFLEFIKTNNVQVSFSPLFKNFWGKKHLEDKMIIALDMFERKQYQNSYDIFETILKEDNDAFNAYFTMLASVYSGYFERGKQIYDNFNAYQKRNYGQMNVLFTQRNIDYSYAFALAEMKEIERSLELLNRMVNELRKESDSDFKKKLIELIDIMPITDDVKKKYKTLINR